MAKLPHASITEDRVIAMCMRQLTTLDNPGICIACGAEADGCEPDAENYTCEACGESCVMGAQQILIAGCYHPGGERSEQARGLDNEARGLADGLAERGLADVNQPKPIDIGDET